MGTEPTASDTATPAPLSQRHYIGAYEVVAPLAEGGMAEVYLCQKTGMGGFRKDVVCKAVQAKFAAEKHFVEMFLDEARVSALMQHPNLIHIYEVAEQNGIPYIAMEYVRGPTLSRLLRASARKNLARSSPHAAAIFAQVCAGLDAAHSLRDSRGRPLDVVHRDLTPQNVLVGIDGVVKVIDFGVAKQASQIAQTEVGTLKGKIAYMAPELLQSGHVDSRTDIYAAAVSLYFAVTGAMPFDGATQAETWRLRSKGEFLPPRAVDPTIPEALDAIILKGMAEKPEDRYQGAAEMGHDLEAFASAAGVGQPQIAAWVAQAYPNAEMWSARSIREAANSPNRSALSTGGIRQPGTPPTGERPDSLGGNGRSEQGGPRSGAVRVVALAAVAMVAGLSIVGALAFVLAPAPPPAAVAVEASPDNDLRALLDDVEAQLREHHLADAQVALDAAMTVESADAMLQMRTMRLRSQLDRLRRLAVIDSQIASRQFEDATAALAGLRDRDPADTEVARLQLALNEASAASINAPAVVERAWIKIDTTPSANVFVDDVPVGKSPLVHEVSVGTHRVVVSAPGHASFRTEVSVDADETGSVRKSLAATATRSTSPAPEAPAEVAALPIAATPAPMATPQAPEAPAVAAVAAPTPVAASPAAAAHLVGVDVSQVGGQTVVTGKFDGAAVRPIGMLVESGGKKEFTIRVRNADSGVAWKRLPSSSSQVTGIRLEQGPDTLIVHVDLGQGAAPKLATTDGNFTLVVQ